MVETMREYDGAGLAANQVHTLRQIAVIEVLANRAIRRAEESPHGRHQPRRQTPIGEEMEMMEGFPRSDLRGVRAALRLGPASRLRRDARAVSLIAKDSSRASSSTSWRAPR